MGLDQVKPVITELLCGVYTLQLMTMEKKMWLSILLFAQGLDSGPGCAFVLLCNLEQDAQVTFLHPGLSLHICKMNE